MKTKRIILYVMMVIAATSSGLLSSCGGDEPAAPTKAEQVTKILTAKSSWSPPSTGGVTVDGMDVTQDLFQGFSIAFTDGTLTTQGTTPVWLRQDTWHFKDESATIIVRGQDSKEVTIKSISNDQLVLSLTWDQETYEPAGGKTRSIKGTYEFTLN